MKLPESKSHSAKVRLELHIGTSIFPVTHIGNGHLIFPQPILLPGNSGEVYAFIDDNIQRWDVTWQPSELPREILPISPAPILQPT